MSSFFICSQLPLRVSKSYITFSRSSTETPPPADRMKETRMKRNQILTLLERDISEGEASARYALIRLTYKISTKVIFSSHIILFSQYWEKNLRECRRLSSLRDSVHASQPHRWTFQCIQIIADGYHDIDDILIYCFYNIANCYHDIDDILIYCFYNIANGHHDIEDILRILLKQNTALLSTFRLSVN